MRPQRTWVVPVGLLLATGLMGCDKKTDPTADVTPEQAVAEIKKLEGRSRRLDACIALARTGPHGVSALTKALEDDDWEVRFCAVIALDYNCPEGPQAKELVPGLVKALNGPHCPTCQHAASTLRQIGPVARDAVPALIKALNHPSSTHQDRIRRDAVLALGRVGPSAQEAVPALVEMRERQRLPSRSYLRMCVSCALTKIAPEKYPAEELVATLIEQLTEEDPDVRWGAVLILAELGPAAKRAIPALVTALEDEHFPPRLIWRGGIMDPRDVGNTNPVLWAIEKIDPEKAKQAVGK